MAGEVVTVEATEIRIVTLVDEAYVVTGVPEIQVITVGEAGAEYVFTCAAHDRRVF